MMVEVEVKAALRPEQAGALAGALPALGFAEQGTVSETDRYFNAPDRDFPATDEALRLRTIRPLPDGAAQTRITYKGPKLDAVSSTRRELETAVADYETMHALLLALGYRPTVPVRKTRRSFTCGEKTVCLDHVEGLGDFIELEIVLPDGTDREAAVQALFALLQTLGIPRCALTRESYLDLLLAADGPT